MTAAKAEPLLCLDSNSECVEQLTNAAISYSNELKTIDERIGLLNRRLGLAEEGINYGESKLWTNYLPDSGNSFNPVTIINPFSWIKNLLGGGQLQRDRLLITDLEIRKADLEASRAELERQREVKKSQLSEQILTLLLSYESAARQEKLIRSSLNSQTVLMKVVEIDYRFGGSSTDAYLGAIAKQEHLKERLTQAQMEQQELLRKLSALTGRTSSMRN
ncbi:hypothetical protein C7H19_19525 [Aphanothece hegewaldii CCALA 016]|uniref:TolC family protein n=1 Tax=Aphanothece hegewaldii CCALA 016 TaxID=2107694 RepID=A0A2T1LTP5_9CHRO|nr:hypothetical protein [Aphanothece hegewaldii]PSF33912.1 hypothetical protein C7H19_19525 [Aphanothece hegewaldii CCALA 016]